MSHFEIEKKLEWSYGFLQYWYYDEVKFYTFKQFVYQDVYDRIIEFEIAFTLSILAWLIFGLYLSRKDKTHYIISV